MKSLIMAAASSAFILGQREQAFHQLESAPLIEFLRRHQGHQFVGNRILDVQHQQNAFAADERVSFGQQVTVQQVQGFVERVGPIVAIGE